MCVVKGATAAAAAGAARRSGDGGDEVDVDELENDPSFEAPFEHRVVSLEPGADFKSKFGIYEELGRGRFGVVFKVVDKQSEETYAAKFIRCRKQEERQKVGGSGRGAQFPEWLISRVVE